MSRAEWREQSSVLAECEDVHFARRSAVEVDRKDHPIKCVDNDLQMVAAFMVAEGVVRLLVGTGEPRS